MDDLFRMEILIALVAVIAFVWFGAWGEKRSSNHLYDFFKREKKDD